MRQPRLGGVLFETVYRAITQHRVGGRFAHLAQLSKPGSTDSVERMAHLPDGFSEYLRFAPCVRQAFLPHMYVFNQIAQRAAQILCIFHQGPPSGLGR